MPRDVGRVELGMMRVLHGAYGGNKFDKAEAASSEASIICCVSLSILLSLCVGCGGE